MCDHCLYWLVQPLQTVDSRFEDERQRFLDLQEMLKSFQRGVQAWLKEIKVYGVCMTCGVHGDMSVCAVYGVYMTCGAHGDMSVCAVYGVYMTCGVHRGTCLCVQYMEYT